MGVYFKIYRNMLICNETSDVVIFLGGHKMAFFQKMTPGIYDIIIS